MLYMNIKSAQRLYNNTIKSLPLNKTQKFTEYWYTKTINGTKLLIQPCHIKLRLKPKSPMQLARSASKRVGMAIIVGTGGT